MFHIDDIHATDALWKIEGLMLREWLRREPAFILFPNDRRIQTFFNSRPDRKAGSEVVAINGDIRSIADADLFDLIEEMILGITSEHICHARFHTESDQCEQTFPFPLFGFVELIITQLDSRFMERVSRVR